MLYLFSLIFIKVSADILKYMANSFMQKFKDFVEMQAVVTIPGIIMLI